MHDNSGKIASRRLAFLCGVPGAGKTTLSRSLQHEGFHCIEMGDVFREMHGVLFPGEEFGHKHWMGYFKRNFREETLGRLFGNCIRRRRAEFDKPGGLLLLGNKFQSHQVEEFSLKVLVEQDCFENPLKLLLNVDPGTAYRRRMKRKNQRLEKYGKASRSDDRISPQRLRVQVFRYRKRLKRRNWKFVDDNQARSALLNHFGSAELAGGILPQEGSR